MIIEIEEVSIGYKADCLDLPGSPPVGMGSSPDNAVIDLLLSLLYDKDKRLSGAIEIVYK